MPEGILQSLHADHEEVLDLIDRLLATAEHSRRETLFRQMMVKLLAHAHAEQTVLYTRLMKSDDFRARGFAYEGENEHQLIEQQLQQMLRAQNKASEQWTAQLVVLRELVGRHVREEENNGFVRAKREFDADALERLGQEFLSEKERQLSAA
ncbi:MAG TPA: hemerythrin domain-containing protein [Stellaceae bacterium]|nr:hemerythrin domain-containing protein [Stellaceae bacterium]